MIVIFFGSIAIAAFMRSWIALTLFTGLIFLSIPLFSLIWAMIAAKSIEIRRELPDEGVAGEQLFATYQLTSRSFFSAFGVRFTDNATRGYISGLDLTASSTLTLRESISLMGRFFKYFGITLIEEVDLFEEAFHKTGLVAEFPITFPPLIRGSWFNRSIPLIFPVRGKYRLGPGEVEAGDPLGLFRFTIKVKGFTEVLILPTWASLKYFPMGGTSRILRDENIPRDREGASPEFLGIREYKEGDPLKFVHWKSTARHNQLMVKQFVQQVESNWGIVLDLRKGFNAGKGRETSLEYMIECTAGLLEQFDDGKIPHVLALAADDISVSESLKGECMFDRELRMLAASRNDGTLELQGRVDTLADRYPGLSWILITARKDQDIIDSIESLNRYGGNVLVVHVNFKSFLTQEFSSKTLEKWHKMWGSDMEDFDNQVLSTGAELYTINRGNDLSLAFFNV